MPAAVEVSGFVELLREPGRHDPTRRAMAEWADHAGTPVLRACLVALAPFVAEKARFAENIDAMLAAVPAETDVRNAGHREPYGGGEPAVWSGGHRSSPSAAEVPDCTVEADEAAVIAWPDVAGVADPALDPADAVTTVGVRCAGVSLGQWSWHGQSADIEDDAVLQSAASEAAS